MKTILYSILLCLSACITQELYSNQSSSSATSDNKTTPRSSACSFKTINTFLEFPHQQTHKPLVSHDKWAVVCALSIKSKIAFYLNKLCLQWYGTKMHQIGAALYQKRETDKELIPIEDNLICSGQWNPTSQQLIFSPHKKIAAADELYLVLNYPEHLEPLIRQGHFYIPSRNAISLQKASR